MSAATTVVPDDSPFHWGELELQTRTGSRESLAAYTNKAIRSFMPDQHRQFFEDLPFVVLGSVDEQGNPWASMLSGRPGFMHSPLPTRLDVSVRALPGDPLAGSLAVGKRLGLIGLDPRTRRRNRVNVHVVASTSTGFSLEVDQSFGNCPQYIQRRSIDFIREPGTIGAGHRVETLSSLDEAATTMIARADTFFVSSYVDVTDRPDKEGVDVSHRGGQPGFIKVDGNTLTIPDYSGNRFFNTLGNFLANPKAGLLFADFNSGELLQLSGTVELLAENDPAIRAFKGAERGWRFHVQRGLRTHDALPFRSSFMDYSPNTLMTGNWQQVEAKMTEESLRSSWRDFRVSRIVDESTIIRSFHLEPDDDAGLLPAKAGQHLLLRVTPAGSNKPLIRSYTLSSSPADDHYRISVKREARGTMSRYLHEHVRAGDRMEIKAPAGDFWIDPTEKRPAVLLAAGVGITPMIAMAKQIAELASPAQQLRHLTILHACHSNDQRAFADEFMQLQKSSNGQIDYHRIVSEVSDGEEQAVHYERKGRINADMLRSLLSLDDYDFMLCGPSAFMQSLHDELRSLGVPDHRIQAEAFGLSSLIRDSTARPEENSSNIPQPASTMQAEEAEEAMVHFVDSGFEQRWSHGDPTLLELAEAHGLSPDHGCRSGNCGSCATRLISGQVSYRTPPTAPIADTEVLICCAVPAKGAEKLSLAL
ncbi:FAD-binding oxidoreductase [Granulosicoccus sp. 3-233]|uniref:FAD-binding oxidoreductase n=1 Tax=Granulosicoccus sp. 3-233 TaxID=3417969 RepID=UPI003D32629D